MNLNPNSGVADLEKLPLKQQRNVLDNRIGRYFNLVKPGGISTELGNFYFCKHPDYLPGLTKKASGFLQLIPLQDWQNIFPIILKLVIGEQ